MLSMYNNIFPNILPSKVNIILIKNGFCHFFSYHSIYNYIFFVLQKKSIMIYSSIIY